jgi:hypothetical protein
MCFRTDEILFLFLSKIWGTSIQALCLLDNFYGIPFFLCRIFEAGVLGMRIKKIRTASEIEVLYHDSIDTLDCGTIICEEVFFGRSQPVALFVQLVGKAEQVLSSKHCRER